MLLFNETDIANHEDSSQETAVCNETTIEFFYECTLDTNLNQNVSIQGFGMRLIKSQKQQIKQCLRLQPQSYASSTKGYILSASLNFTGKNGLTTKIDQSVQFSTFRSKFLTLVQTDKPKYKPGDIVKIRIFFIHVDRTAVSDTDIRNFHVEIRNKYDDVLNSYSVRLFKPKVYTNTFSLSNEAFEGNYKIMVWVNVPEQTNIDDETTYDEQKTVFDDTGCFSDKKPCKKSKRMNNINYDLFKGPFDISDSIIGQIFTVEKYVLTEFTLNVITKRIVRPYTKIFLNISGEYSFGISVIGRADVFAKVDHYGKTIRTHNTSSPIGLRGETFYTITIDIETDLKLSHLIADYHVDITVHFTDDLSHQKIAKHLKVTISQSDNLKLVLEPDENYFKPGKDFKINAYLMDIDGKLIESTAQQVIMTAKRKYQVARCDEITPDLVYEEFVEVGSRAVDNFVAFFEVDIPYNTTSIEFEGFYDNGKVHATFEVVRMKDVAVSRNYVILEVSKRRLV